MIPKMRIRGIMKSMSKFKQVMITGANRGIGLEFVNHYLPRSERIFACCRKPTLADALQDLTTQHSNIEIIQLDVTEHKDIQALIEHIGDEPLDLLVNNAGVGAPRDTQAVLDTELWTKVFAINTIAPIQIASKLLPNLQRSNQKTVAFITSKMGSISDNTSGGATIYRSSKAALNAAVRSFAIDHQNSGVISGLLHPGWVRTDMGGPNGLIDVHTSVAGMADFLENLSPDQNAHFYDYQDKPIPW